METDGQDCYSNFFFGKRVVLRAQTNYELRCLRKIASERLDDRVVNFNSFGISVKGGGLLIR